MFSYLFGSAQQQQPTDVVRHMSEQAAAKVVLDLDDEADKIECFKGLTSDQQDFVFPLLPLTARDKIFLESSKQRQTELLRHYEAYCEQKRQAVSNLDNPSSFFFFMKEGNYEVARLDSTNNVLKQSFVVNDAKLLFDFDLKPFKYQRKLMERHIERIVLGLKESRTLYHPIVLAHVPARNSLTILDGQHRWNALKRLPKDIDMQVQIDVYTFTDDDDTTIMNYYKFINTNVPIDESTLETELEYVRLIDSLKRVFGQSIRHFKKEAVPTQFVDDTSLKMELQYREVLKKMKPEQVIQKLEVINKGLSAYTKDLSMIERRLCDRNNFYLGVQWPLAIDLLEQSLDN